MGLHLHRWISHPALALGGAALAGLREFLALARSRRSLARLARR